LSPIGCAVENPEAELMEVDVTNHLFAEQSNVENQILPFVTRVTKELLD
jgi:hypothetical protein